MYHKKNGLVSCADLSEPGGREYDPHSVTEEHSCQRPPRPRSAES